MSSEHIHAPRAGERTPTALVVEDDMLMADKAEEMLAELGYATIPRADDVSGALKAIDERSPDIVVLDASLRGSPAYQVAAHLKARGIPFVVASGHDLKRLPSEFAFGVPLPKPYQRDDLARALRAAKAEISR